MSELIRDVLSKSSKWISKHPKTTIIFILIITLFFAVWIPKLEIDNSIDDMLPSDHPARQLYDHVDETFGGSDLIIVTLRSGQIFDKETLSQIIELTDRFEGISGIDEVNSMATAKRIEGKGGTLLVRDLMPKVPKTTQGREDLKEYVLSQEMYLGTIIATDGQYAGLILELLPEADDTIVYNQIQNIITKQGNSEAFSIAGGPVVNAEMASSMKKDLVKFFPFIVLILMIILYMSLRTVQGVIIPLSVVILSVIWTLGLMALTGTAMAMISTTLPVMLIAIGVADAIHILTDYYDRLREGQKLRKAILLVTRHIGTAIVLTSITTAIGFLSLYTSPVSQVKEFGLFIGFGVMAALVISVTLIPAGLSFTGSNPVKGSNAQNKKSSKIEDDYTKISSWLTKLAGFVVNKRYFVLGMGLAILIFSIFGWTQLTVETNTLRFFRPQSSIRKATQVVDKSFGGSENLSVIVNGDIKDPQVLNSMLDLQKWAEELPQVGYTISIADYVAEINEALHGNHPSKQVIPDTRNAVAQEILLYEMSGDPSDFEQVVNYDYDQARISMRIKSLSSGQLGKLVNKIEGKAQNIAGGKFGVQITGSSYLFKVLTDLLVKGQIISLLLSLVAVSLIIWGIFKSIKFGVLSIIPLGFTISLNFGLMGWLDIPLDTATTMLASIAIGIGIDYTIHFLSRYSQELKEENNPKQAIIIASGTTGKAITFNAIAVASGFVVLMMSSFTPIARLGALVALTMAVSALAALTLLPAALLVTRDRQLKVGKKAQILVRRNFKKLITKFKE